MPHRTTHTSAQPGRGPRTLPAVRSVRSELPVAVSAGARELADEGSDRGLVGAFVPDRFEMYLVTYGDGQGLGDGSGDGVLSGAGGDDRPAVSGGDLLDDSGEAVDGRGSAGCEDAVIVERFEDQVVDRGVVFAAGQVQRVIGQVAGVDAGGGGEGVAGRQQRVDPLFRAERGAVQHFG